MESLKFPIHNLTKKREIEIDLHGVDRHKREFHWQVTSNQKYGHPGELAYKLDTIIINRRIEAAGRIKPKIIKLGSLRGICRELGITEGKSTKNIKIALLQNASAFVRAKFTYRSADGSEISIEKAFTRYKIRFYGQTLSDGRKASAVFLELDEDYQELVNSANTRPLDYNYLRELTPASQRFYELASSIIFPALRHDLPHAKYLYSSFCTSAPLTRYFDSDSSKKQMYKILKPHKDSGYLESVTYYEIQTSGQIDWEMHLVPGERARAEYNQFYLKQKTIEAKLTLPEVFEGESLLSYQEYDSKLDVTEETVSETSCKPHGEDILLQDLLGLGVAQKTAEKLTEHFRDRSQEWVNVVKTGCLPKSVRNISAYVTKAILEDYGLPQSFIRQKKANQSQVPQNLPLFQMPQTQLKSASQSPAQPPEISKTEYEEMCKRMGIRAHGIDALK